jgi:hypothetical protein
LAAKRYECEGIQAASEYRDDDVFEAMDDKAILAWRILCVIDTYSQTSAGIDKANVPETFIEGAPAQHHRGGQCPSGFVRSRAGSCHQKLAGG